MVFTRVYCSFLKNLLVPLPTGPLSLLLSSYVHVFMFLCVYIVCLYMCVYVHVCVLRIRDHVTLLFSPLRLSSTLPSGSPFPHIVPFCSHIGLYVNLDSSYERTCTSSSLHVMPVTFSMLATFHHFMED